MTSSTTPWLSSFAAKSNPKVRLFCFPYAGGSGLLFRAWASLLPPYVEVIGISTPGKGSLIFETPCKTVSEIVERLLQDMLPLMEEKPFYFFGHSNGALISFELCNVLKARCKPQPEHLFLSASPAPWSRTFEKRYSEMSDEELKETLRDLNGTPPEVLEHRELLDLVLPGLRADFALSESYTYAHDHSLTIPTTLFRGEEDEVTESQILAWGEHITSIARVVSIAGGHFFIHSHQELLVSIIRNQLHQDSLARASSRADALTR
jgi:medium-chain acyl-[acyl-carrier-protein] hydrolase